MPACRRRAAPLRRSTRCCRLLGADEVAAAVLLPAGFVVLVAEGLFLAETDRGQPVGGNAQRNEVLLHGAGAAIAERQVVFRGAALVAVAFNGHAKLRIVAQKLGGLGERLASVGANVGLVEVEIGIAHFISEDFVVVRLRRLLWRRRRSTNNHARGGVCGAARAARGDGVRRGIGGRHLGRAFGGDRAHFRRDGELRRVRGAPAQHGRLALVNGSRTGGKRDSGLRLGLLHGRWRRRSGCHGLLFAASRKHRSYQTATNNARYNGRETSVIRILLRSTWITRVRPTEGLILTPAGWFRAISRITIYYTIAHSSAIRKKHHLGDQLGDSLCPVMVSSWPWLPSASMVQICRSPLRVDSKTM